MLFRSQFDLHLYKGATYADLAKSRKGPFVVISATDMSLGRRLDFTQEYFDVLCLDLTSLPISRAVASSSAVPLVFSPITLNNNGGNCHYQLPDNLLDNNSSEAAGTSEFRAKTRSAYRANLKQYQDSQKRPYIHLLDGGLTDNLGLRSLLDASELYSNKTLYDRLENAHISKIIIINVNAQTLRRNEIDSSAEVPGTAAVARALTNIPIDKYSEDTQRQFQKYVDLWNSNRTAETPLVYYISINLLDLPNSPLRDQVIHIPTTFYLARNEVNNLRKAAKILLKQSKEYQRLIHDIGVKKENKDESNMVSSDQEIVDNTEEVNNREQIRGEIEAVQTLHDNTKSFVNFINVESIPIGR